jgi:hypothetical protein
MQDQLELVGIKELKHYGSPEIAWHLRWPNEGVFHPNYFIVDGWVHKPDGKIKQIELVSLTTGQQFALIDVNQSRPDVIKRLQLPGRTLSDQIGFYEVLDIHDLLQDITHTVVINAILEDGKIQLATFVLESYSCSRELLFPDFMIAGSMKCGTTALYEYICQHPHVKARDPKEIHYFTFHLDRGEDWYRKFFYKEPSKIVGEASPSYFDLSRKQPEVVGYIKKLFPKTKILLVLRHPTDRAISHFYHDKIRLKEHKLDIDLFRKENLANFANVPYLEDYIGTSFYLEQLDLWRSEFSDGSLLILKSEDLLSDSESIMRKVLYFLDLDESLYSFGALAPIYAGQYPEPPADIIEGLDDFFLAHNHQLKALIGIDFTNRSIQPFPS